MIIDKASYKTLLVALLCFGLGACAAAKPKLEPQVQLSASSEPLQPRKQSILDYVSIFLALSPELQRKELAEVNQAYAANKQFVDTRVKLALLYGLPASKVRDAAKAQALLEDLMREPSLDTERKPLVSLVRDYLVETTKLSQKLRDEQKRSDNLQTKIDMAQQKADSLQRKLDELKNIEKTMTDRDQGSK